jgi:hypothetical protein
MDLPLKLKTSSSFLEQITSPYHLIYSDMTEILPADVFAVKNDRFQYYTRLYSAILLLSTYKPSMSTTATIIAISVFLSQCVNLIGKMLLFCATA